MNTKHYFLLPLITVTIAACGGHSDSKAEKEKALQQLKVDKVKYLEDVNKKIAALEKDLGVSDSARVKDVVIAPVEASLFEHYIDVQGSVDARENVNVSSRTMGIITAIYVKEGQSVAKGQVLAQVDDQLLKASIAELHTQLDLANTLFSKQQNLWNQKIGSELQYLNAKNNKESLEKKLATMQDQLAQARIIAPISGSVDAVIAKVGDNAAPGSPAFRVVNANNLKVKASVAEAYAGMVRTGGPVILNFPDIQKEIRTNIGFASRTIDPLSRTINVEVALKPDPALRPNMIARLRIIDYTANAAIVIPVGVIQYSSGKPYVITAQNENGKTVAKRRDIELGRTYNDKAEVKGGLQAGDKIVTTGYQGLNDNDLIKS
ncbi:efflux RND transporter periplasmic adaptor subunit [Chitinophaga sp. Cy-1792]|uniref:efflux RND transporter periplasmic adaptor subunit n=1 Tax=Chitinophaga sp. Cy-1792 TaxID=2608339 RepID=UPI00141FD99B|nr:efflux RND transporter periplasmic adaptor subunit [Chitinophaga sp. Cy-1792]NIG52035.1 efflux RND transporter periplasmic adaptor subunit [Chitinophaga sp. Cy-1792]